jgi:hypothetical protein
MSVIRLQKTLNVIWNVIWFRARRRDRSAYAETRTQPRPWQCRGIGRHRAGCCADDQLLRDRFEIGAEMHRAFVDQNGLLQGFDADIAVHRLIRKLRPVGAHHNPDVADPQSRRRPHVHVAAAIIRTGGDELSVG